MSEETHLPDPEYLLEKIGTHRIFQEANLNTKQKLTKHIEQLRQCRSCPKMIPPAVSGGAIVSRIILVGQAPGDKEPKLGRPFAWTAGKTLFGWFKEGAGLAEAQFRSLI